MAGTDIDTASVMNYDCLARVLTCKFCVTNASKISGHHTSASHLVETGRLGSEWHDFHRSMQSGMFLEGDITCVILWHIASTSKFEISEAVVRTVMKCGTKLAQIWLHPQSKPFYIISLQLQGA